MKRYFLIILTLILSLVVTACGPGEDTDDNPVVETIDGRIDISVYDCDTLNPILTKSWSVIRMSDLIFDGLVRIDEKGQAVPELCESYDISADGLSYTFYLRKNVAFHDGSSFTSADVKYSLDMIDEYGGIYESVLDNVEGYSPLGAHTFEITLEEPMSLFVSYCDFPVVKNGCIGVLDGDTEQSDAQKLSYVPVGTGLYKYNADESSHKTIKLNANQDYYLEKYPDISEITVAVMPDRESENFAFDASGIDVMYASGSELMSYNPKSSAVIENSSNNNLTFIGINTSRNMLADVNVRRAISCAVDRENIVKNIMYGYGVATNIPVNPESWLCNTGVLNTACDYDAATALLEKSGFEKNEDGIMTFIPDGGVKTVLSLDLLVNAENEGRVKIAEKTKADLEHIGIKVNINKQSFDDYEYFIDEGAYDMFVGEVRIDKSYDLSMFGSADAKYCVYEDAVIDNLLERSQSCIGDSETAKIYGELCTQFADKYPIVPLFFGADAVIHTPSVQADFNISWGKMYGNIADWIFVREQ